MNLTLRAAFRDELIKIAGFKDVMSAGWNGHIPGQQPFPASGWTLGRKDGQGVMGKIPLGAKTMLAGSTLASMPGALRKEDPAGRGRSRAERVSSLAGRTLGGLAASGAMAFSKPLARLASKGWSGVVPGMAAQMAGVGVGGYVGEHLLAAPFEHARHARERAQHRAQMQQPAPQPAPVAQQGIR